MFFLSALVVGILWMPPIEQNLFEDPHIIASSTSSSSSFVDTTHQRTWLQHNEASDCGLFGCSAWEVSHSTANLGDAVFGLTQLGTVHASGLQPIVELIDDTSGQTVRSSERPEHWLPVRLGPLTFRIAAPQGVAADAFEFFVDGRPVPPDNANQENQLRMRCPPLGRHLVQGRLRQNDRWSQISAPVRFEVVGPPKPEIVGIGDADKPILPVADRTVQISTESMRIRLANCTGISSLIVYVDHEPQVATLNDCCLSVSLGTIVTPGVHTIRVGCAGDGESCSLVGQLSAAIAFDYQPAPSVISFHGDGTNWDQIYHFSAPAQFPQRDFGMIGEAIDSEGVLIYEDMAFVFRNDGTYPVTLQTNTPKVPATLRLRILVRQNSFAAWQSITLRPIHVASRDEVDEQDPRKEFQQHVVDGQSATLRSLIEQCGYGADLLIRREGSARLGHSRADVRFSTRLN